MPSKTKTTKKTASDQPMVMGSQADYDEFESAAQALPASEVTPMRADLQLALHNVKLGVASIEAERDRVEQLADVKVEELTELPRLVLATIFADTQIQRTAPASEVQTLLVRAAALRSLLLKVALGLVEAGLLPRAQIEAIQKGSGAPDMGRDCVALAAVFTKNAAALRGKHPLKAAQIEEASQVGTDLLKALKSGRARRPASGPVPGSDMRDRLWTLVVKRHDALWKAGAFLFGRDQADAKVPSLQASRGGRPKKAPANGPAAPTP